LSFPKSEKIWNVDTARHGFHPIRRAGAGRAARNEPGANPRLTYFRICLFSLPRIEVVEENEPARLSKTK
jgi:hypothetical protein